MNWAKIFEVSLPDKLKESDFDDNYNKSEIAKQAKRALEDEDEIKVNRLKTLWRGIKHKVSNTLDDSPVNKFKNMSDEGIEQAKQGIKTGVKHIGRTSEDLVDAAKHYGPKAVRGLVGFANDNPGTTGAIAAAIAAGLGGLALRNKLKKFKQQQEDD